MKVILSITCTTEGLVQKAGYTLYDESGQVLASESSGGYNVMRRSPTEVMDQLLTEAKGLSVDCDPSEF